MSIFTESPFHGRLRSASRWLFWLGILMVVLGIAAIVWPAISTLVATLFIGWMMLLSGVVVLMGSFTINGTGPFFGAFLLALLSIAAGVFLLFNPQEGAVALTLVVAVVFLFQGAFEMVLAVEMRPFSSWVWMLISAIVSIAVALLIAAAWPTISLVLLGILFGVNFITTGVGYISIAHVLKPSR